MEETIVFIARCICCGGLIVRDRERHINCCTKCGGMSYSLTETRVFMEPEEDVEDVEVSIDHYRNKED